MLRHLLESAANNRTMAACGWTCPAGLVSCPACRTFCPRPKDHINLLFVFWQNKNGARATSLPAGLIHWHGAAAVKLAGRRPKRRAGMPEHFQKEVGRTKRDSPDPEGNRRAAAATASARLAILWALGSGTTGQARPATGHRRRNQCNGVTVPFDGAGDTSGRGEGTTVPCRARVVLLFLEKLRRIDDEEG
jgi:hypothetical protein